MRKVLINLQQKKGIAMTKINQIYRCNLCGNLTEITYGGAGELVCCGQPMELLQTKNKNEGNEKHVPVVEKTNDGIKVSVGSISHPMEDTHYIAWVRVIADGIVYRKTFKPGEKPIAEFGVNSDNLDNGNLKIQAYCNIHGLWSN